MKVAVITGASAGLGRYLAKSIYRFAPEVDCFWLIARRKDALQELAKKFPDKETQVFPLDLCDTESFDTYKALLEEKCPDIRFLINNAGCGFLGNLHELSTDTWNRSIDLNIRALTDMTALSIPYMSEGSHIINVSSIASFCPNPRMTVYSSTKAYISSFTRGLKEELLPKKISVTAVCPGPMSTEFLDVGGIKGNSKMFETLPYSDPRAVAEKTVKAALKGKTFYTPKVFFKIYRVLAKLVPHAILVKFTKT